MPAFGRVFLCVCECVRAVFGGCSLSSFFSFSFLFSLICVAALPNEKKDAEERSRKHNFRRFSLLLLFIYFPLFNLNVACIAEFINFAICYGMENKLEDEKVKRRHKKKETAAHCVSRSRPPSTYCVCILVGDCTSFPSSASVPPSLSFSFSHSHIFSFISSAGGPE